ncbi:MAG: FMN-binding protein [Hungatella sp.]|nr:FMN-binding protein [Hungatella sp.]
MKKTLLAGALLAVSTGLAACGQSGSGQQADNTTAAPETTTAAQTQAATEPAKETTVVTGEAEGYGGTITAEVTLDGDKIVDLKLTGDGETPAIGGAALESLQAAIIEKGAIDGVDAVSGATWTSNGAFDAVRRALGIETEGNDGKEQKEVSATGLSHGIGFFSSGRLGPGKDDKDTGVYSINEVIAYVLFDDSGKILDLEVDQLEVATPNYDGEHMPKLTGFPGQSYNADEDHDEKVDTVLEQTDDTYLAQIDSWVTKRERGNTYKLNSGTWEEEMDLFEETFCGMTVAEVKEWYTSYCSDLNGRPLHGTSEKEEDVAKYNALSEEEKAALDAISSATMSLNDAHGNLIAAIEKAYENRRPVEADSVAKIGLGITNTGRLGPGKDDKDVGVYSFNTQAAGACFDAGGKIIALYTDVMEVATPNYDGEHMPKLTGFPGHTYNADEDHDEKVDTVLEQTEDTFLAQIDSWATKRERGDTYKLNSGTWAQEMDLFEEFFAGMTTDEVSAWFAASCSDLNGRPLHGASDKEEDVKKLEALSDEQKQELDSISGATMSLRDPHGDLLGAVEKAWSVAKDTSITIGE